MLWVPFCALGLPHVWVVTKTVCVRASLFVFCTLALAGGVGGTVGLAFCCVRDGVGCSVVCVHTLAVVPCVACGCGSLWCLPGGLCACVLRWVCVWGGRVTSYVLSFCSGAFQVACRLVPFRSSRSGGVRGVAMQ